MPKPSLDELFQASTTAKPSLDEIFQASAAAPAPAEPAAPAKSDIRKNPILRGTLFAGKGFLEAARKLPGARQIIESNPEYQPLIDKIGEPKGAAEFAGNVIGTGLGYAPAWAGGVASVPKKLGELAAGSLGIGAQDFFGAKQEGKSLARSATEGLTSAGTTYAGGKVLGAAGKALMNLPKGMRDVAGRIHNWLVKTPTKAFNYGKNPIEVMQKEGITANTITDYAQKATDRLKLRNQELDKAVGGSNKTVNVHDIIDDHFNAAKNKLSGSLKDRSGEIAELDIARARLDNKYGDLANLKLQDAIKLKRQLASDYPFTYETKDDIVTKAAHKIYHEINDAVEVAEPKIAELNQRVSSLIDINKAARNRMAVESRNNPIGLIQSLMGFTAAGGAGHIVAGGEGLAAGLGTALTAKALSSPAVLTRVANGLSRMAEIDKINLYKAAPWFKQVAKKAEDFSKNGGITPEIVTDAPPFIKPAGNIGYQAPGQVVRPGRRLPSPKTAGMSSGPVIYGKGFEGLPAPATKRIPGQYNGMMPTQIKAMIEKLGGKLKTISHGEKSVYSDEPTIYFDDAKGSTKTIRPSQLSESNIKAKMAGQKITEVVSGPVIKGRNPFLPQPRTDNALPYQQKLGLPFDPTQTKQGKFFTVKGTPPDVVADSAAAKKAYLEQKKIEDLMKANPPKSGSVSGTVKSKSFIKPRSVKKNKSRK